MTVARGYAPVEAYVELLLREIALVGRVLGGRLATHLHWGGGTPTILAPRDFRKVMAALREIAPEVTGHGLPLSKCEAYKRVYDQPYGSS